MDMQINKLFLQMYSSRSKNHHWSTEGSSLFIWPV